MQVLWFAFKLQRLNTEQINSRIVLSDHLEGEKIKELIAEYVDPFLTEIPELDKANEGQLQPRRVLGHYVTYIVKENEHLYSVIIKRNAERYGVQCDCQTFVRKNHCLHTAAAIYSADKQIDTEEQTKALQQRQLEKQNEIRQLNEASRKQTIEKLRNDINNIKKPNPVQQHQKLPENIPAKNPADLSKPFIIPEARDFRYYKLIHTIPELLTVKRKNKSFSKSIGHVKAGFDIRFAMGKERQSVSFRVNDEDNIEVTCTCGQCYQHHICGHSVDCVYFLTNSEGFNLFLPYINQDKEKNKLLSDYGLTINDKEAEEFKFSHDFSGRLHLSSVPSYYINNSKIAKIKDLITPAESSRKFFRAKEELFKVGLLLYLSHDQNSNTPVRIEATKIEPSKKGEDKYSRININKEENIHLLAALESDKNDLLMAFSYLSFKNITNLGFYGHTYYSFTNQYNLSVKKTYLKYFYSKLEENWSTLALWGNTKIIMDNDSFAKSNLKNVNLALKPITASLNVENSDRFIKLIAVFSDEEGSAIETSGDEIEIYNGQLLLRANTLYFIKTKDLYNLLETMPKGKLLFPAQNKDNVVRDILYPISRRYDIVLPEALLMNIRETPMIPAIHLREFEERFLLIEPRFYYDDYIIEMNDKNDHYLNENNENFFLVRQKDDEVAFVEYIRSMHTQFKSQNFQPYFVLPFEDVMKNNWFINFSRQIMSDDIKLVGFHELKKFKYNTATPTWDMKVTSGIDWFDIHITAIWGDQTMGFKDIRKAIINGQSFVVLGDGSFGMLPEEWIKKYSSLFKFGVEDKSGLKVSKKHFNIVELLFDQINNEDILAEIEEKKQKLLRIENVKPHPIPTSIRATLRPYQEAGYQWMQVLDEISWGGCLADDMGLGKTLQAITFLAYIKEKYNNPTSLIICPTSLIYNWESELNKFAPHLKYHLFYGIGREFTDDHFNDYDVIISSYGIVRNDIENLVKFEWEYVILDESQAIKNPDAISTKAVQLLKARNKFILSGTPMQNNTYDIYAQFNFLNPGLLGGRDFFRQEFANPIDKSGDKDAGILLRRLIKPFMLRRTKSEVAPDLPEKTEMVLWCQMEKAQKAIYDEYKDYYRHALLQKIETEGMAKAGVYILEGLLRLRQICDDPRLIKDKEIKADKGVKIQELVREINENIGDHKMLVFSQFTEMLALIRTEMDESNIKYCYLDGSTPAAQRKEQVEIFQNQKNINVFLISLKAGGVGLNLTEADYVYIVDPWWNPAVEQQAIDRTHRIGQKNKIFAYKMICKDSVEEKIMLLQEKKLLVSKEIVQEDSAFFKSLTKDDIGFLFS